MSFKSPGLRLFIAISSVLLCVVSTTGLAEVSVNNFKATLRRHALVDPPNSSPPSNNSRPNELTCAATDQAGVIICNHGGVALTYENLDDEIISPTNAIWWEDLFIVIALLLVAGLMSGLTLGLMGMDPTTLEILSKSGTATERKYAKRLLPLIQNHHLLLVTLLLMNSAAMEALPIFFERMVHPIVAILLSVTLLLFVGEIIPQAVCSRYGLVIGANLYWLVWFFIGICFVVAWPVGKLLDVLLGHDNGRYFRRAELKELVSMHGEKTKETAHKTFAAVGEETDVLTYDEITIIRGALDLKNKTTGTAMTALKDMFMVDIEDIMNKQTLQKIAEAGHSRIPVYRTTREHIIGMILTKNLILLEASLNVPVSKLSFHRLPNVPSNMSLYSVLNIFQTGRSHMAVVVDVADHVTPLGIITLEDVIEELIQEEIEDEADLQRKALQGQISSSDDSDDSAHTDINTVYWGYNEEDEDEQDIKLDDIVTSDDETSENISEREDNGVDKGSRPATPLTRSTKKLSLSRKDINSSQEKVTPLQIDENGDNDSPLLSLSKGISRKSVK